MIVSVSTLKEIVKKLSHAGSYGLDTETTGLRLQDRLFSIIIADESEAYYFNFNPNAPAEYVLPQSALEQLCPILENPESMFFMQNAKFDLGMLAKEGLYVKGTIHDTEVIERVLKNNYIGHKPYSLSSIAKRYGLEKDDAVEKYIKENKLITKVKIDGKDKLDELWHFDRVPFETMSKYAMNDAIITLKIGILQRCAVVEQDLSRPQNHTPLKPLVQNEYALTKVCFRIERQGIKINREYTMEGLHATLTQARIAMQGFEQLTNRPYEDSAASIAAAFTASGIDLPKTRTGKPCTNKQVLDALDNPVAAKIREIRGYQKLASTYYSSFLHYADDKGIIHANMRQAGTETLRFSYSNPNLQNLPKEDEEEDREKAFLVRRCFVPLNDEWCFVPIDYKQQEYRMLADYAGEKGLIEAIMDGEDVHEATARLVGISRKHAKTLNFGLLYGMGATKLAKALNIALEDAYKLRHEYFAKLPAISRFIKKVMANGEARRYVFNWMGFRSHISDASYAYVLPNHIIQGGCAQVVRIAMVRVDAYIREHRLRTRIVLQVHDELLFQVHRTELEHIKEFQRIMETVYQARNGIRLDCSVEHSWRSFAKWDQSKGYPS